MENPSFIDDFPSYKPPRLRHVWEARRVFIVLKARLVSLCNPTNPTWNSRLWDDDRWIKWDDDVLFSWDITWWFCFLGIFTVSFLGGIRKIQGKWKNSFIFWGVLLNLSEYLTFFWVEIWQIPWSHEENRRLAAPCQPQHSRPHDGRTDSMVLREKFQLNYDQEERSQWFYDFHGYHLIVHGYHPELIIVDVF